MRLAGYSLALILSTALAHSANGQPPGPIAPLPGAAASAAEVSRATTHQLAFTIPFQVTKGANGQPPTEVRLYVSKDGGKTWDIHDRQPPDAGKFAFRATADGSYLFLVRTIDSQGQMQPPGPAKPELQVLVDTQMPELILEASLGPSGEIRASWTMSDLQLASDTFTLQYQVGVGEPWQAVAVPTATRMGADGPQAGSTMWWPEGAGEQIGIRAQVRDRAGNLAVATRTVDRRRVAEGSDTPATAVGVRKPLSAPDAAGQGGSYPRTPFGEIRPNNRSTTPADQTASGNPPSAPSAADERRAVAWPAEPVSTPPPGERAPSAGVGTAAARPAAEPSRENRPAATSGPLADPRRYPPRPVAAQPPVASRAPRDAPPPGRPVAHRPAPGSLDTSHLPAGERPNMTASRRFQLSYDVDSIGPSGVRRVELWQTRDGGQTWQPVGVDDDNRSPMVVEPTEEGIYGYRVVVEGGNGLSGRPPEPGDLAEIWVGVDWTAPTAELTSAIYGTGARAGQLEIHWQAKDARLSERGVSLLFSDQPDGNWSAIATGLPNDEVYYWQVDGRLPLQIYLRLEVRDEAGNLAVHQLERPIANDGLIPQGRIRGMQPLQESRRRALTWPTRR